MKFNIKHIKEPYVLILIGPPLSGKSTFIRDTFSNNEVEIVSRDQIVMDIYGSDNYDDAFRNVNQKDVDAELQRQLSEYSSDGRNVIIDMTNMTSKRRIHNLRYFDESYKKVAVLFPILEWKEYQDRNAKRKLEENKFIPEHVLKNMISSYQPIRENEGFDKVITL
jgi:predicted kinase